MRWPDFAGLWGAFALPALATDLIINDTAEKAAFVGRIWWPDRADVSKDITKVHFRAGAVTFGGSSQYRLSLQDVSLTAGPPMQPDGTADQSVTPAAGTGPTANAWNTLTLGANRTVALGALVAVVWDYVTFTAGDSIVISGLRAATASAQMASHQAMGVLDTGSWAAVTCLPNVVFEFTDGTFGAFIVGHVFSAYNTRTFASNSTGSGGLNAGDERGLEFVPEVPMKVDGCFIGGLQVNAGATFDVVLYEGTTAVATVSCDDNTMLAVSTARQIFVPFAAEITLSTANTYRLVLKPTTTNSLVLSTITLSAAGHRVLCSGTNCAGNSREDAGAWGTADTTELPWMALSVSSFDDGAGGGVGPGRSIPRGLAH